MLSTHSCSVCGWLGFPFQVECQDNIICNILLIGQFHCKEKPHASRGCTKIIPCQAAQGQAWWRTCKTLAAGGQEGMVWLVRVSGKAVWGCGLGLVWFGLYKRFRVGGAVIGFLVLCFPSIAVQIAVGWGCPFKSSAKTISFGVLQRGCSILLTGQFHGKKPHASRSCTKIIPRQAAQGQAWAKCSSLLGSRLWPQAWLLLKGTYMLNLLDWPSVLIIQAWSRQTMFYSCGCLLTLYCLTPATKVEGGSCQICAKGWQNTTSITYANGCQRAMLTRVSAKCPSPHCIKASILQQASCSWVTSCSCQGTMLLQCAGVD